MCCGGLSWLAHLRPSSGHISCLKNAPAAQRPPPSHAGLRGRSIDPTSMRGVSNAFAQVCRRLGPQHNMSPCGGPPSLSWVMGVWFKLKEVPEGQGKETHADPEGTPKGLTAQPCVTAPAGERRAQMRHEPVVGYRPTRLGVLRIELVDGRTRPAAVRTHGRWGLVFAGLRPGW